MNICICDDDKIVHQEIRECLSPFFTNSNAPDITDCYSGEEIVSHYSRENYFDIVFLDVEMGKINGIEAAGEIRKHAPKTIIIFVSSHRNYVFDSFKCEALHYIVKPITQFEFDDVFNRALNKYRLTHKNYTITWKNTITNLVIDDIIYIDCFNRKLRFHTEQGTYMCIGKIVDTYEKLKTHGFILVHQGYIVNMHYIKSFLHEEIVLRSGERIMVSMRKRPEAIRAYDIFLQKWKW